MRLRLAGILPILLSTLAVACVASERHAGYSTSVDSAGVEIVRIRGGGDAHLSWQFDETFALGGASDTSFVSSVVAADRIAVDDSGRTFILDGPEGLVRIVEPTGAIGTPFGRRGSGPGELLNARGIAIAGDGGVLVTDRSRAVLIHWTRDGKLIDEQRLNATLWGYQLRRMREGIVVMARDMRSRAPKERLVRLHGDSAAIVAEYTWVEARPPVYPSCPDYGVEAPPFFSPQLAWDARDDLVAVVSSDRYQVDLYVDDRLARSLRRDVLPIRVTPELARAEVGPITIERVGCTISAEERLDVRGYHPVFPVISDIAIDPEHRIWVRRAGRGPQQDRIDILSRSGEYVGTLPPGTPFPAVFSTQGRFIHLEADSLDVMTVRMLRLRVIP